MVKHKHFQSLSLPVSKMGITMPYRVGEDQFANTSSVLISEPSIQSVLNKLFLQFLIRAFVEVSDMWLVIHKLICSGHRHLLSSDCALGFVLGAGDPVEDRTDNTPPPCNHQKLTRTFWW